MYIDGFIKVKKTDLSSVLSMFVSRHLPVQICTFIEIPQGFSRLHVKMTSYQLTKFLALQAIKLSIHINYNLIL